MTCVSSTVSRRYCATSSRPTQPLALVLGPKFTSGGLQHSVVSSQIENKKRFVAIDVKYRVKYSIITIF